MKGDPDDTHSTTKKLSANERDHWGNASYTISNASSESQGNWTRNISQSWGSEDSEPRFTSKGHAVGQDLAVKPQRQLFDAQTPAQGDKSGADGPDDTKILQDWKLQQQVLLNNVVDLEDTLDTDRDTRWAPGTSFALF